MINISVNSRRLILKKDTVIKLELVFPDPSKDNLPSSLVQWFNIPAIPENDEIFKHAKYIEVNDKVRIYENILFETSGISLKGKLIVKSATKGEYKVSITFNPFPEGFKDTLLQDLDLASYNLGSGSDTIVASAKTHSQSSYPSTDISFPMIKMGNFYGSSINTNFLSFINYYLSGAYQKNIQTVGSTNGNISCLVPHFYLLAALEAVFSEGDFDISGSFLDNADIKKLIIFNNYALDWVNGSYNVEAYTTSKKSISGSTTREHLIDFDAEIDDDSQFDLANSEYTCAVAGYHTIEFDFLAECEHYGGGVYLTVGITKTASPNVYVNSKKFNVLKSGLNKYSAAVQVNASVGEKFKFYFNANAAANPPNYTYDFDYTSLRFKIVPTDYAMVNRYTGNIKMENHLPNISVSKFINNLVKLFSVAVFTDQSKQNIEFEFWDNILSNHNLLDLTEYAAEDSFELELYKDVFSLKMPFSDDEINRQSVDDYLISDTLNSEDIGSVYKPNQIHYVRDLNKWIISYFNDSTSEYLWKMYKDNFDNINSDISDAKDIEINVNTLKMHLYGYPVSDLAGSSPEFGIGKTDFPFKLLFFHGIVNHPTYGTIPLASSNQYDSEGNDYADFALRLNDTDGIYEQFSKSYYAYIADRDIITYRLFIDEHMLSQIMKLFLPGSKTRKVRIINQNYIPVRFDIEISMDGIKNCKAKLR